MLNQITATFTFPLSETDWQAVCQMQLASGGLPLALPEKVTPIDRNSISYTMEALNSHDKKRLDKMKEATIKNGSTPLMDALVSTRKQFNIRSDSVASLAKAYLESKSEHQAPLEEVIKHIAFASQNKDRTLSSIKNILMSMGYQKRKSLHAPLSLKCGLLKLLVPGTVAESDCN